MNERAINLNAIEINENNDKYTSPNIKRHGAECEFNHQHILAEGLAGLLSKASENQQGSMNNDVINSAAYAIDSAIREMNKCFQTQLKETIKERREDETARKDEIMELVDAFGDEYPALKQAGTDAINNKTSLEAFQKHVLHAIDLKNYELKDNN